MNLAHLINPSLVLCDLKGNDRESVYTEMLNRLAAVKPQISHTEEIVEQIIEHENLISMPYEMGLAIPHTRTANVNDLYIIVGLHKDGVQLKPEDTSPSKIIIMCLISKSTSNIYLLTLRAISMFCLQPGNVDKLAACTNPQDVLNVFKSENVELKHTMTAEDVMSTDIPTIHKGSTLKEAIDMLATSNLTTLAVTGPNDELEGVVSAESVLKGGIPDYIMIMDNLKFLPNLEPFEDLLNSEDSTPVENFINPHPDTIASNTPLIQVIVKLVKREAFCYYVIDNAGKLVGFISHNELIRNVLRG